MHNVRTTNSDNKLNSAQAWQVGFRIQDRYEIREIRKGGMGIVYLAYDHEWEEPVAIKTVQDCYLEERKFLERFKWEAETWVLLEKHPNIVKAKYVDEIEGRPYIFLEYITGNVEYGIDLSEWISARAFQNKDEVNIPTILNFAIQICRGMVHAGKIFNRLGIPFVHRDLKPGNILITHDDVAKVTDFGLVKAFNALKSDLPIMTFKADNVSYIGISKTGTICGTPPYMAPEQCSGNVAIDIRSDIYSFGCVLYEMLTGHYLFSASSRSDFIDHHIRTKPKSPGTGTELDAVILKCLQKDPKNRYQDFTRVEQELTDIYSKRTGTLPTTPDEISLEAWELNHRGVSLVNLGFDAKAISYYIRAIEINPGQASYHCNLGSAYTRLGKFTDGIKELKKALKIDPHYPDAHVNLGYAYNEMCKFDDAILEYQKALREKPDQISARLNIGSAYHRQNKIPQAIKIYKQVLRLDPNHALSHYNLGVAYWETVNYEFAIREYKKAFKINRDYAKAHFYLGKVYLEQGYILRAKREFLHALEIDPKYAEVYVDLGIAYSKQNMYKEAILELKEALIFDPKLPEASHYLEQFRSFMLNSHDLIKKYNRLIKSGKYDQIIYYKLGLAHSDDGDYDSAIQSYEKFIKSKSSLYLRYIKQAQQNVRILSRRVDSQKLDKNYFINAGLEAINARDLLSRKQG